MNLNKLDLLVIMAAIIYSQTVQTEKDVDYSVSRANDIYELIADRMEQGEIAK